MKEILKLTTPDMAELDFHIAGPAARFGAYIIDLFFLSIILILSILIFVGGTGMLDTTPTMVGALLFLAMFVVKWGYFIFFELVMRGQTPGKRFMKIRVLRTNGLPAGPREIVIRNILRAADALPPPAYFIGAACALFSERGQRLGDMAAGTIVVSKDSENLPAGDSDWGANWVARLERGDSKHVVTLPTGRVEPKTLALMSNYLARGDRMDANTAQQVAFRLAGPHLSHFGHDADALRASGGLRAACDRVLQEILAMAETGPAASKGAGMDKARFWNRFADRALELSRGGKTALQKMSPAETAQLLDGYRDLTADLSRVRAMDSDSGTLKRLNRMAVAGHNLIYGQTRPRYQAKRGNWWSAFARETRAHMGAVLLAASLLFVPALITYAVIVTNPHYAPDLVSGGFMEFEPAGVENMHDIPSSARPMFSSQIMTNNLNVALTAFALGLTFGIGTALALIFNGVHIGAVAGWLALQGQSRAFWGWVMPHGGIELLAILLAGAAGFILAKALIAPGRRTRGDALKAAAPSALAINLGVMVMLVIAGLIEGFVSPSSLPFQARILFLAASLLCCFAYLGLAGRTARSQP